jgi:NADH:ubiquinone oxidoreductase subunit H
MMMMMMMMMELIGLVMTVVGLSYLLERSLLGYIHIRNGPNKVSFMGIC